MFVRLLILISSILHLSNSEHQYYRIPPHDISALIGTNVTIPCVLSLPHGDVQWTKDGLALGYERNLSAFPSWSIIGNEQLGEFNFFIESLKLDDEGSFACEVSPFGDAMALKQIAHIRTLVPPRNVRINHATNVVSIKFDEQISQIECQVDGAKPAAHLKWLNDSGHEYPASSRIFSQSDQLFSTISTLTFVPSMAFDRKRFTCQVEHETLIDNIHNLQTSIEIQILSPPDHPIVTMHSSNGSYVTLSCRSYRGHPRGVLTWNQMNSSAEIRGNDFVESNLTIVLQPSDNNQTHSCRVNNDYLESIGEIRQTNITLTVDFGPSFVQIQDKDGNETSLVDGVPRRFLCRSSTSNPRAILMWKLDNETIFPDIDSIEDSGDYGGKISQSTKTLGVNKSLRTYHKKILSCQAKNSRTGETTIDSTLLNVIFDAIDIRMEGISANQTIRAGNKVIAECILIGGNPLGKILWYKGKSSSAYELLASNSFIDVSGTYLISRVEFIANESDHNLLLTCKGQVDQFPEKIVSNLLNVTFPPEKVMFVDDSLLANLSLNHQYSDVFECRTSRSNPPLQLIVYRQAKTGEKHFDIHYRTSTIYIDQINSVQFMLPSIDLSFHENLLICEAVWDVEQTRFVKSINSTLHVNHKPYFEPSTNTSFEITENQSFEITFLAQAYPSLIVYTWFHPSGRQLMNDQMNIFIEDNRLVLKNLQRSDRGVYRCVAMNSIGSTEVNFTLQILYGPIIIRTQGYTLSEAVSPGSLARLLCVIDANPFDLSHVRWYKDHREIQLDQWERRIEGKEVSLIRQSIEPTDRGEYLCEVENSFGTTRATIPLFIQYSPIIEKNQDKLAVDSHRFLSAEFHCLISSLPKPNVTWLKDNEILPISSKYHSVVNDRVSSSFGTLLFDSLLIVANISKEDYGIYQCRAENPLGFDLFDITLTGITSPDPPKDIQISNVSYSSFFITWQPAFNGGLNQTFQLRYRLSTASSYFYENLLTDSFIFHLKNLRSNSEYHFNLRSNNSYHMSSWSDQLTVKTSSLLPTITFHLTEMASQKLSMNILSIVILIGFGIFLINMIFAICFLLIQRRKNKLNHNENLSTTDTNETETNTVDLFQPIAINSYQKYDDEDEIKKPFTSNDNFRLHQYYPICFDNTNPITYRSFKIDLQNPIETHRCIRAELV